MNIQSRHTEEISFFSQSFDHLLIMILNWFVVRGYKCSIDRMILTYNGQNWCAVVYHWVK